MGRTVCGLVLAAMVMAACGEEQPTGPFGTNACAETPSASEPLPTYRRCTTESGCLFDIDECLASPLAPAGAFAFCTERCAADDSCTIIGDRNAGGRACVEGVCHFQCGGDAGMTCPPGYACTAATDGRNICVPTVCP